MRSARIFLSLSVLTAASFAANSTTVNWTATLTAQSTVLGTSTIFSGNTTMSPLGSGTTTATFTETAYLTVPISYTVTLSGGTLTGVLFIPLSATFSGGGAITASATVTGGTGAYAGYTGIFPALTGTSSGSNSESNLLGMTITISGSGALTQGSAPPPTITGVLDAGSYTPDARIAEGSIFVVKGSGLSNPGTFNESFPLPTTSTNSAAGGVSITFTPQSGGAGTNAYLIYEYSQGGVNQLAAVLPSTLAQGVYNVTVTSNGMTSPSFAANVVAANPQLFTVDTTGNGMALVQNYVSSSELDLNRFTTGVVGESTISPAHPGQTLIAYATGLGPISSPDNVSAQAGNSFGSSVQVLVSNLTITPSYAGRVPGFSGLDQINFTLPDDVETGCAVPIVIQENGNTGKIGNFISIAPNGSSACTYPGFTTSQLQTLDNGVSVYYGGFSLVEYGGAGTTQPAQFESSGSFSEYSGSELPAIPVTAFTPPQGCTLYQYQVPAPVNAPFAAGSPIRLDAGTITLNGPSGSGASDEPLTEIENEYGGTVSGLPAGTWTLTAAGGANVGPFTASVISGEPFTITGGLPANIVRANGLTLNWTGGNSTDQVTVVGITQTPASLPNALAGFQCIATAGAGTLTVPASITGQLFAVSAGQLAAKTAYSSLTVSTATRTTFTAPLVSGGSIPDVTFSVGTSIGGTPTFQ